LRELFLIILSFVLKFARFFSISRKMSTKMSKEYARARARVCVCVCV